MLTVEPELGLVLGRGIMFQTGPVRVSAVSVATDQTTIHHPYMVSTAQSTNSSRAVNEISGKVSQYSEMAPRRAFSLFQVPPKDLDLMFIHACLQRRCFSNL